MSTRSRGTCQNQRPSAFNLTTPISGVRSAQGRSAGTVTARDTSALMREGSLCMSREGPSNARHVAVGF